MELAQQPVCHSFRAIGRRCPRPALPAVNAVASRRRSAHQPPAPRQANNTFTQPFLPATASSPPPPQIWSSPGPSSARCRRCLNARNETGSRLCVGGWSAPGGMTMTSAPVGHGEHLRGNDAGAQAALDSTALQNAVKFYLMLMYLFLLLLLLLVLW